MRGENIKVSELAESARMAEQNRLSKVAEEANRVISAMAARVDEQNRIAARLTQPVVPSITFPAIHRGRGFTRPATDFPAQGFDGHCPVTASQAETDPRYG